MYIPFAGFGFGFGTATTTTAAPTGFGGLGGFGTTSSAPTGFGGLGGFGTATTGSTGFGGFGTGLGTGGTGLFNKPFGTTTVTGNENQDHIAISHKLICHYRYSH